MHPRTTTQTHAIRKNAQHETTDVKINVPVLQAEGLGLITWASSSVLANQLHHLSMPSLAYPSKGIRVLEIGAGTGLVGLSAAALWKTDVILTDLEPILPGLVANVEVNKALLGSSKGNARVGALDWNAPERLVLHDADGPQGKTFSNTTDKADIILAADVIYWDEHPRMLEKVILAWLAPGPDARLVFTYPLRVAYVDCIRELWERLESNGLESIQEGREEIQRDDWDDEPLIEWCVWRWKPQQAEGSVPS